MKDSIKQDRALHELVVAAARVWPKTLTVQRLLHELEILARAARSQGRAEEREACRLAVERIYAAPVDCKTVSLCLDAISARGAAEGA